MEIIYLYIVMVFIEFFKRLVVVCKFEGNWIFLVIRVGDDLFFLKFLYRNVYI